jgi:hypothetical protein
MNNTTTSFPNKDEILIAMGFHEVPRNPGVSQILYWIISNSCWFNDIITRYMPNYHQDLMLSTFLYPDSSDNNPFFSNSFYSRERYFRCAMIEYNKVKRYLYHSVRESDELNTEELVIMNADDPTDLMDRVKFCIKLNTQLAIRVTKTRAKLLFIRNKIREQCMFLSSCGDIFSTDFTVPSFEPKRITLQGKDGVEPHKLQTYIDYLEENISYFNKRLEKCRLIQTTQEDLRLNIKKLHKYKLVDDLNMRSIEFCYPNLRYGSVNYGVLSTDTQRFYNNIPIFNPNFTISETTIFGVGGGEPDASLNVLVPISASGAVRVVLHQLPEELVRIVSSFLGDAFLERVKQRCIMDKYFPSGRDDVVVLLKQWRNVDLLRFSEQVYLKYYVNYERHRWRRISCNKSSNKFTLIDNIVAGKAKTTFYDFLRDVFILTKLLVSKRGRRAKKVLPGSSTMVS